MAFADKVKKLIKSRAFLFRLVAALLVFICIPLLAMQIFVVSQSTEEFRKSNQEHYLTLLQGSAQTFASRQQLLLDTAWRMSLNQEIRQVLRQSIEENPLKNKEAADAIGSYSEEILHMEAAGVFYPSQGYLLINGMKMSNGTKYTLEEYCQKIEPEDPENPNLRAQEMMEFFLKLDSFDYYVSGDGKYLIAAHPISLGVVGRKDALAFFVMDATALEEGYRANIACQSSIAVLDENGNFLLKGDAFTTNIYDDTLNDFLNSKNAIGAAQDNGDMLLYRYTDPQSKFTFLLAADRDGAQKQLLSFAHTVRVTMSVMVAVLVISLLATIYITYRPIHRLLQKYAPGEGHSQASEIEVLDSKLYKLDKETEAQQDLLTDFILGDLLFGNAVKAELVEQYFPRGRYQIFTVLTALCPTLTAVRAKKLEEELERVTGYDLYVTSMPSRPHTVIACLSKDSIDTHALHYHTARMLNELVGEDCPVCVGDVVEDIYNLRTSYRSAVMVNADLLKAEPGSNAGELTKKLQVLSQCVYMGDETEALKQLEDIRQFLYANVVGEGHLRYYGFKLLNAYLTSINSSQARLTGQEVELLLTFTGMDHLFKLLSESIQQVCGKVADMEHTMDLQLQQRLLQYVDTHFTERELCLGSVADHVGASIYAVSRMFKEITGKGFKDYVTEKRLECGHHLLCTTGKSIAEIAIAAGFDNANYFSTVFKMKYGLPPTKYRSERKEKQEV